MWRGYESIPSKPITAQQPIARPIPMATLVAAVRKRRVARSQMRSGHRKTFTARAAPGPCHGGAARGAKGGAGGGGEGGGGGGGPGRAGGRARHSSWRSKRNPPSGKYFPPIVYGWAR